MTAPSDLHQAASIVGRGRAYRITWRGDSHVITARSRATARYASWRAFREAGYRADLPTFAKMIRIEVDTLPPAPLPHVSRSRIVGEER